MELHPEQFEDELAPPPTVPAETGEAGDADPAPVNIAVETAVVHYDEPLPDNADTGGRAHDTQPPVPYAEGGPAQPGDYTAVFQQYERPLLAHAYRMLRNQEEARDIVQDTMLKLHRELQKAPLAHVRAWLYTVTTNAARDICRRRDLLIMQPLQADDGSTVEDYPHEAEHIVQHDEGNYIDLLIRKEAAAKAINSLSDTLRPGYILFELQDYSGAEVAEALGVDKATTRVRLQRARAQVAASLKRYFEES